MISLDKTKFLEDTIISQDHDNIGITGKVLKARCRLTRHHWRV